MLASCKFCHREYVTSKVREGDQYVCSKCQQKEREHPATRLGLHPALERKWGNKNDASALRKIDHSGPWSEVQGQNGLPKIPGFDISYQIGRGAMGSVYRAREIKSGRLVAIKVLSHDLSERADLVARFEREAYALKSLNDKNVVTIIDAGHYEGIHYFAMEFIEGMTLRARMNQGSISLDEAVFITTSMLDGLKAAHKHGIIHRDLKPENVLLAYSGNDFKKMPDRVVLVDFGLVGIAGMIFDPHPNLTRSRVTMGTVNYMAPEQHVDAKRVDHRSDIYSAGVILFEMLTGELPLGRFLLPNERGMEYPVLVDTILQKALSRQVTDRYSSAELFLSDLKSITDKTANESQLLPSHPPEMIKKLQRGIYQFRYVLMAVMASIFFAVGVKMSKPKPSPSIKPPVAVKKVPKS